MQVYKVGELIPGWLQDLDIDGRVTIIGTRDIKNFTVVVNTTLNGSQVAYVGDYIKVYPSGTLAVERVPVLKVNQDQMVVHSSLNGMNN